MRPETLAPMLTKRFGLTSPEARHDLGQVLFSTLPVWTVILLAVLARYGEADHAADDRQRHDRAENLLRLRGHQASKVLQGCNYV